jgi:hypothetical protein
MLLGMTPGEYWNGDPLAVIPYRAKYRQMLEYDNFIAYLRGLYNYEAFMAVEATVNRKKGARPTPYISEPHKLNADGPLETEIKRLKAEAAERAERAELEDKYRNNYGELTFEERLEAENLFGTGNGD